jgi:hypothetical protein
MVMFDFSNKETPEYKNYSTFVDIETNNPIPIEKIDKNKFPFPYIENVEPSKIFIQENFLTEDECDYLVWLAETQLSWPIVGALFWDERNLGLLTHVPKHHFAGFLTAELVVDIHKKTKEFISNSFNTPAYADQIGINKTPPDGWQMPHKDSVPHLDRIAGCVIFLNDDFEGGEPFYPYYGIKTKPKKGMIYAHDPGHSHLHGVTQNKNKTRYVISSTWTKKAEQFSYARELSVTIDYIRQMKENGLV